MATVFAPPAELGPYPDFQPIDDYIQRCNAYEDRLRAWVKAESSHKLAGKTIRFPVADGYALYMIFNGREIIQIPFMDNYEIPEAHARGLRASDLAELADREDAIANLFGRSKVDQ